LKAKVAVEAIKAHKTPAQIAPMFGAQPTQVGGWKQPALAACGFGERHTVRSRHLTGN
jgi:hypothetical protein